MIREEVGIVAEQYKQIAVTAECERRLGVLSESLAQGAEPRLGVFPRVEIPVKLVRAKRAIIVGQGDVARSQRGEPMGGGSERQVAIIPVGPEAAREIA